MFRSFTSDDKQQCSLLLLLEANFCEQFQKLFAADCCYFIDGFESGESPIGQGFSSSRFGSVYRWSWARDYRPAIWVWIRSISPDSPDSLLEKFSLRILAISVISIRRAFLNLQHIRVIASRRRRCRKRKNNKFPLCKYHPNASQRLVFTPNLLCVR